MGSEGITSSLVVEKSEVVLLKPCKPTPDVSLSLSTIDNDPHLEVMVQSVCVFTPKASQDPATLLQHAISLALVYYYPLAGKLHRKTEDHRLQLNYKAGDGVPFIRATATCTLSSLSYLDSVGDAAYQLVPWSGPAKGCEGYDPLALQVTKFACGGITIGMAQSHAVCDGVGIAQFFRAMIELACGKTQPTVTPVWDRERLTFNNSNDVENLTDDKQNPKAFPCIATSPYTLKDDMVQEILTITSEDITKLKKTVEEDEEKTNEKEEKVGVTTLEILAAHIWRARCRALRLSPEGTTVLGLTVGIRSLVEPPLPEGYYGNAFVNASITLTAKELSESPLSRVVKHIKHMKKVTLDKRYLSRRLSEIEKWMEMKATPDCLDGGSMSLSDWRQIGLHYNVWGGLVNIIPLVPVAFPFVCILLPASKALPTTSGGVRVMVTLPRDAMAKFKEEMKTF